MEGSVRRGQIPSFGNWDYYDGVPVTQCFESTRDAAAAAGQFRCHFFGEGGGGADLFKVPPSPLPYCYYNHKPMKVIEKKQQQMRKASNLKERSQGRVCDVSHATAAAAAASALPHSHVVKKPRAPKAVDEDLYKIPPEFLYKKKPKKKGVVLCDFWKRCLGLSCIM